MLSLFNAGFNTQPDLSPINDRLNPGELLAIVGPNGAGKSTLISLLSGYRRPERGCICLDGKPLHCWDSRDLARRRAVVAQQVRPSFDWRVRELVGLGSDNDPAHVEQILAAMGLTTLAEHGVLGLSGGEAQRVMIARALCQLGICAEMPPSGGSAHTHGILLLDEPTSALDIGQQQRLMRLLCRLAEEHGLAICCVLHDLNLAARYAHRVWLLQGGRRIASGTPAEVLSAARLAHVFDAELETATLSGGGPPALLLSE